MLGATNFVEHYSEFHATHAQHDLVKSAMYAGSILGMIVMGPLSDLIGRRNGLILCSLITLTGALLSTFAWCENALIAARIITGIGMGGEYPLASSHSAESSSTADGARNVALLYLFGSGGGQALCPLVTYLMDIAGVPDHLLWRCIFAIGSALSVLGLLLRIVATQDSPKFKQSRASHSHQSTASLLRPYWRPLLGTAGGWFLYDIVEYGLKQNDAAIFDAGHDGAYSDSVLSVFFTRLLVIPSLIVAPWLLTMTSSRRVQCAGFLGCALCNLALAVGYGTLKEMTVLFFALYIIQLSFQSLPGVTTMAISAEIFPSMVRGTGAGISAAFGKLGATIGSYAFSEMKNLGLIATIFWVVVITSILALLLTLYAIPLYNGLSLDAADALAREGKLQDAVQVLYAPPEEATKVYVPRRTETENGRQPDCMLASEAENVLSPGVYGISPEDCLGKHLVLYWSRSGGHWVPGTVLGHNIQSFGAKGHWSYELDVQPQAAPSLVVQDWTAKFKSSGQQGYPQPRIMPSALCMTPSPWPMSRHASTPCLFPAPKPKPVAELHVTTRLPRHSDGGPESPVRGSLVRTPSAAGTPISARSPAGSPMLSFRQVRLSQTPDLREPRELQSPSVTQRTVASKVLSMTSLPPTVVPPMPTSLAAPAASPAVPLWPTAATVAARVQVMPPPTPPREHRVVWSGGPFSQRPPSVLRSSGASEENLRSSLGVLSPKGPPVPTGAQTASAQSLLISTARTSSPSRRSPPRLMPNARAQLHTQPAMSVATPAMSCATPAGPGPRSPLSFEPRFQLRTARPHLHQWGLPPDMWGIHFDQLVDLEQNVRFQRGWTTREVVAEIIWPETAGKGIGAEAVARLHAVSKQSWAELSEDLLTDSEPGAWESERYTDSMESPQASPMQSPVVAKSEHGHQGINGATNGDFVCPTPSYSIAFPVIDIAGLPKALCNNVCVEAMLQQAGLTHGVTGFMTDETSTIRVMLANWPAAMHCMDHFKKSSWAGGSLQINWGLAIPQAAQEMAYGQMNSQQNYLGTPINQYECAAYCGSQHGMTPRLFSNPGVCSVLASWQFIFHATINTRVFHLCWVVQLQGKLTTDSYALWRNAKTPLQVAVMVSHAWDDAFVDLLLTLSVVPQQGPLWVASTALYQSEESIMQVLNEPFELMNQVLRGRSLLCVLSTVDVYERLWCLLEMSCAVDLGVEVNTSRKPKGRGAWALDEAFLTACGKPVDWGTWRGIGRGGGELGSNQCEID
ncbi:Glycerophosphoinositol permease 1 (Glycerophosphodiester transporter GIT1) [Durusdinium trenchii]|uniref:Glycerophosphoinositol permease 1 (Glycerophosphodiester transporter GIT1) n=1 Tax=Durusdinium trenchii TaxID=1381693 RepID=A0ABP0JDE9_9DINO